MKKSFLDAIIHDKNSESFLMKKLYHYLKVQKENIYQEKCLFCLKEIYEEKDKKKNFYHLEKIIHHQHIKALYQASLPIFTNQEKKLKMIRYLLFHTRSIGTLLFTFFCISSLPYDENNLDLYDSVMMFYKYPYFQSYVYIALSSYLLNKNKAVCLV